MSGSDSQLSAVESERAILGGVLRFNELLGQVAARISREDFASKHHAEIHDGMCSLAATGLAIDLTTLGGELRRRGTLAAVGGRKYLATLLDHGLSRNLESYIARVREASLRRQIDAAVRGGGNAVEISALVRELDTIAQGSWEPPTPFLAFHLPPFPVASFPGWLRKYVEAVAQSTQTAVDLTAMLSLAVAAAAVAKKVVVEVKPGYREPLNVFTVTALASGNRKSAVFSEIAVPIQEHEERESERCAPEIAAASSSRNILEQRLRKVEGEGAKAKPEDRGAVTAEARELAQELARSVVPAAPRFLADDTSPERLATLLRDQGGRMAILSPEGDIFDLMAGKYSSNNAPNLGVFLKGHAGDTLRVDRVGRPTEYVKNPALTLGLAVQPEVLRGLVDKPGFRGRGLLGRFLYSLPPSLLGRRAIAPPDVPTSIRYDYCWRIQALLGLSFDVDEDGQPASHVLHLSDEARRTWVEFAAWLEPRLGTDGDLGVLTDWAGKLPGAVARLAGILHLAAHATDRTPWALPIGPDTMVDAVAIGRYLIPHARAAFAEMGAHPEIENAKHVAAWLTRQTATTLSERDIFQGTRGRFRQMGALRPALSILVEHGYLRRVDLLSRSFRGRPSGPTFEVNPHVWKTSEDIEHFEHIEEKPGSTDLHALDLPEKQSYSPNDLQSLDPGAIPQNPQYPQKADAPGSVAVQFTAPPGEELSLPDELSSGVGSERLS